MTSSSRTKQVPVADPQKARDAAADRHLDACERRLLLVRVVQRDQQVQRQVRDERERVRRVHRQRRDQREDVVGGSRSAHGLALLLDSSDDTAPALDAMLGAGQLAEQSR